MPESNHIIETEDKFLFWNDWRGAINYFLFHFCLICIFVHCLCLGFIKGKRTHCQLGKEN